MALTKTTSSSNMNKAPKAAAKADATNKVPALHPPVAQMVVAALTELNADSRKGSSLQAIKKFLSEHYQVDLVHLAPFIRRFLKKGVEKGELVQTKGVGASGSFKLAKEKPKKAKKPLADSSNNDAPVAAAAPPVEDKPKKAMEKPKAKPKKTEAGPSGVMSKEPVKKPKLAVASKSKPKPKSMEKAQSSPKKPVRKIKAQ